MASSTNADRAEAAVSLKPCKVAEHVPKVVKTGTDATDNKATREHDAYIEGINFLDKYPEFRADMVSAMKKVVTEGLVLAKKSDSHWGSVSTWGNLDAYWISVQVARYLQISMDRLKAMKALDAAIVWLVWGYVHNVTKQCAMLEELSLPTEIAHLNNAETFCVGGGAGGMGAMQN